MIDLYYWPTPNGHKITMYLEETGLDYTIKPVDIRKGEQFDPDFLKIAPNNRMPAIVDHEPADGGAPVSVFESGAILIYLGEKTGKFLPPPKEIRKRKAVLEWLFWQMGGLGPMAGQNNHFVHYCSEDIPYAKQRYVDETNRLFGVMDERLADNEFLGGEEYSIADMACYPWTKIWKRLSQDIEEFPHVKRWLDAIAERPATKTAYETGEKISPPRQGAPTEEEKKILFGQTAKTLKRRA